MKKIVKNPIVTVLIIIVVIMAIIKVVYKPEFTEELVVQPVITPTIIETPVVTASESSIPAELLMNETNKEADYPLWRLLPYSGNGFTVDRYIAPLTLAVKAKGLDAKIVKTEMEKWLDKNGVEASSHKLEISN